MMHRANGVWGIVAGVLLGLSGVHAQVVCSFEDDSETSLVTANGVTVERTGSWASHGSRSLRCTFPGSDADTWPGISLQPDSAVLAGCEVLAFEVRNPQNRSLQLNWRVDDAHGKRQFGSAPLKAASVTRVNIQLAALGTSLDTERIVRVFPYLRMPREETVLYFDHFRKTTLEADFTPLVYRHDGPALAPDPDDQARGYQLFSRHWLDLVFPTSLPRPGEIPPRLQAFATPGEYEPITLSVHALRDLRDAKVTISELHSDAGIIAAEHCRIYPLRSLDKRVTYASQRFIRDLPVFLERREQVEVTAHASRRFWIDLRVPPGTRPGIYRGVVTFAAADVPATQVPIRVRVLPYSLEKPAGMIFGEYYKGPQLAETEAEKRLELEQDLRDMREHGMTSVGLCFGVPFAAAELSDTGVALNLDGTSMFEHFMNTYRDLGFEAPIVILSDSGQGFAGRQGLALSSPEYAHAYTSFWKAVQAECQGRDWAELIVQPVDEPGWKNDEAKQRNVYLLKLLKTMPGMRTEQDGPADSYFRSQAGPHADVWNYNGGIGDPEEVAGAIREGRLILIYNCDVESYRPEVQRYMAGFFQRRAGIHGCYNWAYMSFRGSPYNDLDAQTGTWMHVYPRWRDEVGGPSIGWQGYREGIDDWRYLETFAAQARRAAASGNARAQEAAAAGRQVVQRILDSIQYSPRIRSQARWSVQRSLADNTLEIGGHLKLPNGWDFQTYDLARWQIAQATLAVLAALGDVPEPPVAAMPGPPPTQGALLADVQWMAAAERPVAEPTAAVAHLQIPELADGAVIDGTLDESSWRQGGVIPALTLSRGGQPQAQTRARLFSANRVLYVGIECDEEFVEHMTATIDQDGGALWHDDCVELFFDTNLDRSSFRQVIVNSLGRVTCSDSRGKSWSPQIEVAAAVGRDRWWVELAIPLEDLDLAQTTFGFNLCRERRPTEVLELSSWSPTGDRFGRPERFGQAVLGASFFTQAALGQGLLGLNTFSAVLHNPLEQPLPVRLQLEWQLEADPVQSSITPPLILEAGAEREIQAPYSAPRDQGKLNLRAILVHAESAEILAQQTVSQEVPPALTGSVKPAVSFLDQDAVALQLELAVAEEMRRNGRLVFQLTGRDAGPAQAVTYAIDTIAAAAMSSTLDVSALGAGQYELRVLLYAGGNESQPRAVATLPLVRMPGPFAE